MRTRCSGGASASQQDGGHKEIETMEAATSQPLTSSSSWNTVGLAAGAAMPEGLTVTSSRSSRPTRMGAKSKISPSQMLATDAQDKLTCRSDFMSCVLLGWHSKKDSKNISKQKASNKGPSTSATINDRIQVKSQSAESILLTLLRKTRVKHTKNTQQQMSKHQKTLETTLKNNSFDFHLTR